MRQALSCDTKCASEATALPLLTAGGAVALIAAPIEPRDQVGHRIPSVRQISRREERGNNSVQRSGHLAGPAQTPRSPNALRNR
jgi:hypothetical protein